MNVKYAILFTYVVERYKRNIFNIIWNTDMRVHANDTLYYLLQNVINLKKPLEKSCLFINVMNNVKVCFIYRLFSGFMKIAFYVPF